MRLEQTRLGSKATSDVDRLVTVCMFHGTSLFTHIVPFHSSSLPAPSPLAGGFDQAGLPCDFAWTIIAVFSQAKLLLHPSALQTTPVQSSHADQEGHEDCLEEVHEEAGAELHALQWCRFYNPKMVRPMNDLY